MMRKLGGTLFSGAAILLVSAMTAWACTNLSTLNLSEAAGQPGARVDVTGSSFATADSGGRAVQLHWNGDNGEVLAKAKPNAAGSISAAVKVPADAQPGYNVIVATQATKEGPAFGTPARASFRVGSAASSSEAPPSGVPAGVVEQGTSTGVVALTVALGLLGIVLFGAGLSLFSRELRRRSVPAPARTKK